MKTPTTHDRPPTSEARGLLIGFAAAVILWAIVATVWSALT